MSTNPATGDWAAAVEVIAGDRPSIPGYEILDELGRGGMGVVYKARQVSLKRLVALKLIRDSALASPEERARFRIEAEAAARMRHPNIVAIYEIGEHVSRPYFVMELVEGGSLDKLLAGQPQPPAQAAVLVRIVALAVQHAHEQKVVHRDLKPANILLQKHEGRRIQDEFRAEVSASNSSAFLHPSSFVPKLSDFGLAKRLDSDSTALTREGSVLGTASYMAPEQAEGRVGKIGPAVDVYALGAILYELLTGQPPFQAETWNQIVQQVLQGEPVPPTRLQPDVPRNLETVCLKCLEKEAGQRYASAGELADDLGHFLNGRPVAAVPVSERERLDRLAERNGYQIVATIGRGPRSTVYHALEGPLKQAVALKVYRAGVCTREEWEAWLRRAADRCAGLTHPHLVPIRQAGWWDGAPCLTLEYVPHGSLAAKLSGQPYPILQALRLAEQLAEILCYLHRQGVVHGNLKPANVLLAANSIPRVADFHLTGGLFQPSQLVDDLELSGVGYLAPELVRDAGAEPRPYTDIYGLGMILYELLTGGRPPFGGAAAHEVREQVLSQDPIPPSRLNPKVTPQLEACCLRCLRKNPWRRYHRAYDLLMRLRYFQDSSEGGA
jgi:eukaryotic-like serine/threonine-protein kinase